MMSRLAEPVTEPLFATMIRIMWSPGANLICPPSSIEPPSESVRTLMPKSAWTFLLFLQLHQLQELVPGGKELPKQRMLSYD